MSSLFFWRKKRPINPDPPVREPAPAAASAAPGEPRSPANAEHGPLPTLREVCLIALQDSPSPSPPALTGPAQMNLLMATSQACAKIGPESRYTPRRPSMLAQLLESLRDEEASLRSLARLVAQDPALTGALLRTANSPLYRASGAPIEGVDRAAAMLGTTGIRALLASSVMQPLATGAASGVGKFGDVTWEHALCSASAAEAWAARNQEADPFIAHLLALIHGLGSVAVYRVVTDLLAATPGAHANPEVIAEAVEANSATVAARIAGHWGLSDRTQQALLSLAPQPAAAETSPLARALRFGLLAGTLILLCRLGKATEAGSLKTLESAGFGAHSARVWDRLVRAYVRP